MYASVLIILERVIVSMDADRRGEATDNHNNILLRDMSYVGRREHQVQNLRSQHLWDIFFKRRKSRKSPTPAAKKSVQIHLVTRGFQA